MRNIFIRILKKSIVIISFIVIPIAVSFANTVQVIQRTEDPASRMISDAGNDISNTILRRKSLELERQKLELEERKFNNMRNSVPSQDASMSDSPAIDEGSGLSPNAQSTLSFQEAQARLLNAQASNLEKQISQDASMSQGFHAVPTIDTSGLGPAAQSTINLQQAQARLINVQAAALEKQVSSQDLPMVPAIDMSGLSPNAKSSLILKQAQTRLINAQAIVLEKQKK